MSGGRLPPSSNAFSVGQQQPYINHDGVNHFQSPQNYGAFVQPEKKGVGQESQHTPVINSQAESVPQEMNPALRGEEMSNDRLGYRNVNLLSDDRCRFRSYYRHLPIPFHPVREAEYEI